MNNLIKKINYIFPTKKNIVHMLVIENNFFFYSKLHIDIAQNIYKITSITFHNTSGEHTKNNANKMRIKKQIR